MVEPWISSSIPLALDAALVEAVDDALHELGRGGEALGLNERVRLLVEADEVGERSADVDGDDKHVGRPPILFGRQIGSPGLAKQPDLRL